jgi:hypothetical protein
MARDYEKVLEAAEDLLMFTGYLGSEDLKLQANAQNKFAGEVGIFVYDLLKETPDSGALAFSVSADLDRIAAEGSHSEAAIAGTRAALLAEIARSSRHSPATRFFFRWGSIALAVAGFALAVYLRSQRR